MHFIISNRRAIILLFVGWLLYTVLLIRPWEMYFLNDDFHHIPDSRMGLRSGFFRPIPQLINAIELKLFNSWAAGYHYITQLLHLATTLIVFVFLKRVLILLDYKSAKPVSIAFFTALLFLIYPFHSEALMFIVARGSILCTLFAITSYYFFIAHNRLSNTLLFILFFVLSLLTYETAWNALIIYALLYLLIRARPSELENPVRNRLIIAAIVFTVYLAVRISLLGTLAGDGYDTLNQNLQQPKLLLANFARLIARTLAPPRINSVQFIIIASLIFLGLSGLLYHNLLRKKLSKALALSLLIAIVSALAPAMPLGIDTHYGESDRYLYYASVFASFLIVLLIIQLRFFIYAFCFLAVGCIIIMFQFQQNFAVASLISKKTITAVDQNIASGRSLVFINLPERQKGSVLFRTGLEQAINWLVVKNELYNVSVLSTKPQANANRNFAVVASGNQEYRAKNPLSSSYINAASNNVIYFIYSDNLLTVVK